MTSTNFVFPPPPPPPSPSANLQNYHSTSQQPFFQGNTYHNNSHGGQNSIYGRGASRGRENPSRGSRGGSNGGSSSHRGDSRANGHRLGSPGVYMGHHGNQSHFDGYDHQQAQQAQHNFQGLRGSGFIPTPQIPSRGGTTVGSSYASVNWTSVVPSVPSSVFPHHPTYQDQHGYPTQSSDSLTRAPFYYDHQSMKQQVQPTPYSQGPGRDFPWNHSLMTATNPSHRGHGQKRAHSGTSSMTQKIAPRVEAPPAVPEFGTKPMISSIPSQYKGPKPKKKRKHNQLGLTPKTEEHESSEEEDVNEESRLAAMQPHASLGHLQFSYKGRTATLSSSLEIAAWVEERKKRYPTKKRADEEARRKENLRHAEKLAPELRANISKVRKEDNGNMRKGVDDVAKARLKAEKLRKQYQKAERRVAEIEANNSTDLKRVAAAKEDDPQLRIHDFSRTIKNLDLPGIILSPAEPDDDSSLMPTGRKILEFGPKKFTVLKESCERPASLPSEDGIKSENLTASQDPPSSLSRPRLPHTKAATFVSDISLVSEILLPVQDARARAKSLLSATSNDHDFLVDVDNASSSESSELSSSDEDDTSSSGSSSANNDPTEVTSKHTKSDRVLPNKSAKTKTICKLFLTKGFCSRGDQCQYLHELPKRGSGKLAHAKDSNEEAKSRLGVKRERISLYQRMLRQQEEKEDDLALQHIIFLGEHDALNCQRVGK